MSTSFAGCHGLDDEDPGDSAADVNDGAGAAGDAPSNAPSTPSTPAEPGTPSATITLKPHNPPASTQVGTAITVAVNVDGDSGNVESAEIGYAKTSFQAPAGAAGNGIQTIAGTPSTFAAPGRFSVEGWTFDSAGKWHYRPHVVVDGVHYWGDAATIDVVEAPPAVEQIAGAADVTVTITLGGGDATYDADPVTIRVGQSIAWDNTDTLAPHTATADTVGLWNSGNIAQGEKSPAFKFNTAGTYTYHCNYHPKMTGAQVIVQ